MRAIEKAWKENLQESKDDQWESKKDLIANCCPYGEYKLNLKGFKDDDELCSHYHEHCTECWNTEIIEDPDSKGNVNSTFSKLDHSPITSINIYDANEEELKRSLERNTPIIFADNTINYDEIPSLIKWLQDTYDYCTELKNKIEYVGFVEAKWWMCNYNGIAEREGVLYDSGSNFTIEDIDSDKWILIKTK